MIVTIHTKSILFLTSVAAFFAIVPASQAAPAFSKGRTLRIHEIHRGQSVFQNDRRVERASSVAEEPLFRSHVEREMINPG